MFEMIIKWLYVQSLQVVWYFDTRLHTLNRNWRNKLTYECMNIWIWFKWFSIVCQWYSICFALASYHKHRISLWSLSAAMSSLTSFSTWFTPIGWNIWWYAYSSWIIIKIKARDTADPAKMIKSRPVFFPLLFWFLRRFVRISYRFKGCCVWFEEKKCRRTIYNYKYNYRDKIAWKKV